MLVSRLETHQQTLARAKASTGVEAASPPGGLAKRFFAASWLLLRQSFALGRARRMGVHLVRCLLFWNPVITLCFGLYFQGFHWKALGMVNWQGLLIADIVSLTCFSGVWCLRKLELAVYRSYGRTAPVHLASWYTAISIFVMPFGLYLAFWTVFHVSAWAGTPWEWPSQTDFKVSMIAGVLIAFVFVFFRARGDARDSMREAELRIQQLENERLQAQLSALTAQMNPHLLFNALNTVASLIATDPARAEDTTIMLSELYRGVLESSRRNSHSLATELELCATYLKVEQARFGERLKIEVLIAPGVDPRAIEIPVLTIQPLVENAVRHGLSPRASGGTVRILIAQRALAQGSPTLEILVEDDGVGIGNSPRAGAGTGLANCRERLRLGFGGRGTVSIGPRSAEPGLSAGGTRVSLSMPIAAEALLS